ncbi:MAG: hypothetical protein AB7O32_00880 [Vicinamibacterales bacterium]
MERRYVQPAIVGGLAIGVLSALPIVSAANICCCFWVVLGGFTAAYLLQQGQDLPITPADGALVGLMAGGVGAVCYLLVSIPVTIIISPLERALLERLSEASGSMPPEFQGYLDGAAGAAVRLVLGFLFMLFAAPAFATVGGLIGAALIRKPEAALIQAPVLGGQPPADGTGGGAPPSE